jgi:hypothetical protein
VRFSAILGRNLLVSAGENNDLHFAADVVHFRGVEADRGSQMRAAALSWWMLDLDLGGGC